MKASKLIAAVVSGAAALALVGGIAYAIEPDRDPATLPMPEAAQGTSIAKQVASIIVYEDQEEAVAMASEFDDIHDELALDAVSSRASLSAKHSASHDASSQDRRERCRRDARRLRRFHRRGGRRRDRAPRDHLPRRRWNGSGLHRRERGHRHLRPLLRKRLGSRLRCGTVDGLR